MATHLAAQPDQWVCPVPLAGAVALGYPLKPPGPRGGDRVSHLRQLAVPTLVVQGTRDTFGGPDDVRDAVGAQPLLTILPVATGDHSMKVQASAGKPQAEVEREIVAAIAAWMRTTAARPRRIRRADLQVCPEFSQAVRSPGVTTAPGAASSLRPRKISIQSSRTPEGGATQRRGDQMMQSMSSHDGSHRKTAIDVREQLASPLEVLVDHRAGQRGRVDLEDDKVGPAAEVKVGHPRELMRIRAVNEPVGIEGRGHVLTDAGRIDGLSPRRDVEDRLHTFRGSARIQSLAHETRDRSSAASPLSSLDDRHAPASMRHSTAFVTSSKTQSGSPSDERRNR